MIRISLGNVGSGKTAMEVRNLYKNPTHRVTYSNIKTRGLKNSKLLKPEMIAKREMVGYKQKRGGEKEPVYDIRVNMEFWKDIKEPINVVLDEAHSILNARRAMSKANVLITDWLALIRRVLGENSAGTGELVLITQLPRRLDPIARDMAHQVAYHVCHYSKTCTRCGTSWGETSEMPKPSWVCLRCGDHRIQKHGHIIEIKEYAGMDTYMAWKEFGIDRCYQHYFCHDIEQYFQFYNTLQWDNLFSEIY
jgi:hypothetical protein